MSIFTSNNEFASLYLGSTEIQSVYLGTDEVWSAVKTVTITADNISQYFTVTNSSYYFAGNGSTFTSNNAGKSSSTAQTTLTALTDMTIDFTYSYSSEANYDNFYLTVGETTVETAVSGSTTTKTYSGILAKGQTIVFKYMKDSSVNKNNDCCTFSNMTVCI